MGRAEVFLTSPSKFEHVQKFVMGQSMTSDVVALLILVASLALIATAQWPGLWRLAWSRIARTRGAQLADPASIAADPEFAPLSDAARLAFDAVENTAFAEAATSKFHSPRGPLSYMATMICMRVQPDVPLYGKRAPSTVLRQVAADAHFSNDFSESANELCDNDDGAVTYTCLAIKRADLPRIIEHMKDRSGAAR